MTATSFPVREQPDVRPSLWHDAPVQAREPVTGAPVRRRPARRNGRQVEN